MEKPGNWVAIAKKSEKNNWRRKKFWENYIYLYLRSEPEFSACANELTGFSVNGSSSPNN